MHLWLAQATCIQFDYNNARRIGLSKFPYLLNKICANLLSDIALIWAQYKSVSAKFDLTSCKHSLHKIHANKDRFDSFLLSYLKFSNTAILINKYCDKYAKNNIIIADFLAKFVLDNDCSYRSINIDEFHRLINDIFNAKYSEQDVLVQIHKFGFVINRNYHSIPKRYNLRKSQRRVNDDEESRISKKRHTYATRSSTSSPKTKKRKKLIETKCHACGSVQPPGEYIYNNMPKQYKTNKNILQILHITTTKTLGWVQCSLCDHWFHYICVVYNSSSEEEYICFVCEYLKTKGNTLYVVVYLFIFLSFACLEYNLLFCSLYLTEIYLIGLILGAEVNCMFWGFFLG